MINVLLTISIVLYCQDEALLVRTLGSLSLACLEARKLGLMRNSRLILIDHSPQLAKPEVIASWRQACGMDVDYCHDPGNPGFGAGHNAAFRRAVDADFFLIANPDLDFAPDSLVTGLGFLAAHPATGIVAPALDDDDGLRPACFRPPDALTLILRGLGVTARTSRRIARYECRDWDPGQPVFVPPLMSGCCLLFRADVFDRLGGFDPNYFLYFEDFDLTRRAARLGVSAYCPTMRVKHAGGGAGRKGFVHAIHFLRSALRFFSTHGWRGR